jgi:hypothetical protein
MTLYRVYKKKGNRTSARYCVLITLRIWTRCFHIRKDQAFSCWMIYSSCQMDKKWANTNPIKNVSQNRIFSPLRVGSKTIENEPLTRLYDTNKSIQHLRHYTIIYKAIWHYTTLYNVIQDYITTYKGYTTLYNTIYNVTQNYTTIYKVIRHYTTLYKTIKITTLYKSVHDRLYNTTQRYATLYDTI